MPRVFVSYAHESAEHQEQVLTLAHFLVHNGIEVDLDWWVGPARRDRGAWATKHIEAADFIILVASPGMRLAGGGHAVNSQQRRLQNEAAAIRDLLHRDRQRWLPKLLPVVLPCGSVDDVPLFMQPFSADRYSLDAIHAEDEGCEDLLRVLTGQPRFVPPPLGQLPDLPPLPAPGTNTGLWNRLTEPAVVRWRTDLFPRHEVRPNTVELHLAPVGPVARIEVRRLEPLSSELAAIGRTDGVFDLVAGPFPATFRRIDVGWSSELAWAHHNEVGLAVTRDGQRSAWFALPGTGLPASIMDRTLLAKDLAKLLNKLASIAVPTPRAVAPALALDPAESVFLDTTRSLPLGAMPIRHDSTVNRVRTMPDDSVHFTDLTARVGDLAEELAVRLISQLS